MWAFRTLEVRPGPELPPGQNMLTFGWRQAWNTIIELVTKYKQTAKFFLSYAFYTDALITTNHCALLICQEVLHMSMSQLLCLAVLASCGGMLGITFAGILHKHYRLTSIELLQGALVGYILESAYLCCNLVNSIPFGLKQHSEAYCLATVHGFLFGIVNSYSRALCAELTPKGREASIASFFQVSEKGSCWFGPLCVFFIHNKYKRYSGSFPLLGVLIIAGFTTLLRVDSMQGRLDAINLSKRNCEDASLGTGGRAIQYGSAT